MFFRTLLILEKMLHLLYSFYGCRRRTFVSRPLGIEEEISSRGWNLSRWTETGKKGSLEKVKGQETRHKIEISFFSLSLSSWRRERNEGRMQKNIVCRRRPLLTLPETDTLQFFPIFFCSWVLSASVSLSLSLSLKQDHEIGLYPNGKTKKGWQLVEDVVRTLGKIIFIQWNSSWTDLQLLAT